MNVNGESAIVGHVSWVIWGCDRSNIVINKVLATFIAKNTKDTIPTHLQNERQQSVNDFGSCIMINMSGACSQVSINKDMAAFMGRYVRNISATASGTVITHFIYRATAKYS